MNQPESDDRSGHGVQVITRAIALMRTLQQHPGGLTQSELSETLGLPRSTVHRLLGALEAEEMVEPTHLRGRYRLGPEIARLARSARRDLGVALHPYLADLSRRVGETVDLAEFDTNRIVVIDQVTAPHFLRAVSFVGMVFPLHLSAVSKVVLAEFDRAEVRRLLPAHLPPNAGGLVRSRDDLEAELDAVRRNGVAYDFEEHHEGVSAVATGFTTANGAVYAIGVPMPVSRFRSHGDDLVSELLTTREQLKAILDAAPGRQGSELS